MRETMIIAAERNGETTMRLIDAECDALMETIGRRAFGTRQDIRDWLDSAPTIDAVPVVRCGDCKYHREINEKEREYLYPDVLICTNAEFIDDGWNPVWPDDFCNYGER